MALHIVPASMLKESLFETLEAAKYCAEYRKTDEHWGQFQTGGCLGYPAAVLLFSIVDTIGSQFRGNESLLLNIDAKQTYIKGDGWEHFKILNSKYFKQNLTEAFIQILYRKFRSFLTHNSLLGKNCYLVMQNPNKEPFFIGERDGETIYIVSIMDLYELCKSAIDEFYKDIDLVVPQSRMGKKFH